jgi:hypothetical protein
LADVLVIEPRLIALPLIVKAPAPLTNEMLGIDSPPMLFTFGDVRVLLLNSKSLPVVGAEPPAQFELVLQVLFAPPPVHVKTAAGADADVSNTDDMNANGRARRQKFIIGERDFMAKIFLD